MTTGSVLDILIYVFDRYMLGEAEPDTERLKRVVLMVLSSQPGHERAVARLGRLVDARVDAPH
jgi:uncharacterized protein Smg (DUF494 family)